MNLLKTVISTTLSVLGALWLLIELVRFFGGPDHADTIRSFWWVFLLVAIGLIAYQLWPRKRIEFLVSGRDIAIELVIGDIFKESGAVVIGSNTRFEINPAVIAPNSVQGLFTAKYCKDMKSVNQQINAQVRAFPTDFGATVTVHGTERTAYFCAIAEMNNAGVAQGTIENLREALGGLWSYLAESADKGTVNVPVLGSGYSRITASREELIREIVLSFLAALTESNFCDRMRIVIHPKDVKQYKIDIERVQKFIAHSCEYTTPAPAQTRLGTGEG
ncbi:macro domain-containing protein [Thioalkalivibrio sp. ALE23]|uniref:macro domain-containing protein n=1 Tax=Thioalkalivibrio sp. ALE23 TaxID=1265495 RepID=UPI0012DE2B60|nr:macro domain-containing protein [Thioalkalivibrio sp. ALE23]